MYLRQKNSCSGKKGRCISRTAVWVAAVGLVGVMLGCGGGGGSALDATNDSTPALDATNDSTPALDATNDSVTPNVTKLTLSLNAILDGGGDVKAASITKAELLDTTGTVVKTATISGGTAQFDIGSLKKGDYFIKVNGLADDLVPTRIDDPTKDLSQFVGKKLRATVIGSLTDPTYRIKTYSKGQGEHAVVKYSDGTSETPEQHPYALVALKADPKKLEVRVLGTAVLLTSYSAGGHHSFAKWILGGVNHGKSANFKNDAACSGCHGTLDTHVTDYSSITTSKGWCYKCHYGKAGDPDGMVDPKK